MTIFGFLEVVSIDPRGHTKLRSAPHNLFGIHFPDNFVTICLVNIFYVCQSNIATRSEFLDPLTILRTPQNSAYALFLDPRGHTKLRLRITYSVIRSLSRQLFHNLLGQHSLRMSVEHSHPFRILRPPTLSIIAYALFLDPRGHTKLRHHIIYSVIRTLSRQLFQNRLGQHFLCMSVKHPQPFRILQPPFISANSSIQCLRTVPRS
jgi:hypothetical protein